MRDGAGRAFLGWSPGSSPGHVPILSDGVVTWRAHRPQDADRIIEQCQRPGQSAWVFCVLTAFHRHLKRREIYAGAATRWRDPRAQLLADHASRGPPTRARILSDYLVSGLPRWRDPRRAR